MRVAVHVLTGLLGASVLAADVASAATCFTLEAELTHLQSGSGAGGNVDRERYQRAYEEQIEVIARTEARARDAGCFGNGSVFFEQPPDGSCGALVPRLNEMQVNLGRLDRLRSGDNSNVQRIREVQGMMADRGCGGAGGDTWRASGEEWSSDINPAYNIYGTFRTVCVRTCDGYYFPISYATTAEQFPADARTCSSMCPGADARLYSYANPGGRPEDMTSIDGAAYTDLPTAFLYRSRVEPGCACNAGSFALLTSAGAASAVEFEAGARLPRPRQEPGEDPETLANRAGNFVPRVGAGEAAADAVTTAGGRTIRVIGPAVGATPEQEGALAIPIPTEPPPEEN